MEVHSIKDEREIELKKTKYRKNSIRRPNQIFSHFGRRQTINLNDENLNPIHSAKNFGSTDSEMKKYVQI